MGIGMLLILLGLMSHQFETMIVKYYGKKHQSGGMFFNAVICLFAMIYFIVTDKGGLQFPKEIFVYGIINSFMYATGFYMGYVAYKTGSYGLTRLFTSFVVIISTFYGIVFLKEPATIVTYIALALILSSLFLMNHQKNNSSSQKISFKWITSVILVVLSNAGISIIGRMQYGVFGDTYKNEFLTISLAGAAISLFVLGMLLERDSFKTTIRYGLFYGAAAGIFNAINNLLVLVTYNFLPISFTAPVRSGLGILIGLLFSVLFYREKFSKRQWFGAGIGVLAVVLMNI